MVTAKKYSRIVYDIIGAAMEVHSTLSFGLLESIYQEALSLELANRGIESEREKEILTYYKNCLLEKRYKADIVVGDIILELKSVSQVLPAHRAQLCNYLRLTKKPVGLLINFGEPSLVGERWIYDETGNNCFLVNKDMEPISDVDYTELFNIDFHS